MREMAVFRGALIVVALFFSIAGCGSSPAAISPEMQQRVTDAFTTSLASNGFPGGVFGMMRADDGASFVVASGMAEAEDTSNIDQSTWTTKVAMTSDTRTRVASVSKPFTAMVILILIDRGYVTLDDVIDDFFPGLVPNSSRITVRNLLNMASGLYDHENSVPLNEATLCGDMTVYYSPEELIAMSNEVGGGAVMFEPGAYYTYINTNFTILAMIAQQATGQTYGELVTDLIIGPLNLTGTSVPENDEATMAAPYAHGYDIPASVGAGFVCVGDDAWRDYSVQNMSWDLGAGSIVSTSADLMRFMKAIMTGELISAELHEAMLTPPAITDFVTGAPSAYGFGLMVLENGFIGHEGANAGYNTQMCYYKGYYFGAFVNAGIFVTIDGQRLTESVDAVFSNVYHSAIEP